MIVIGAGRIGTAIAERARAAGLRCDLVDRERGWEALDRVPGEPVVLAVRNDDLDAVLARVPEPHRKNLVLVQNGMLRPWLARNGLQGVTRGLLFLAVQKRGDEPVPGGESPFTGPLAVPVVALFREMGLPARAVAEEEFAGIELEKLIWNSAFGLLSQVHGATVGEIVREHPGELRALVAELLAVGGPALEVDLDLDALVERLCAYSLSIADYRGAVKEWPWRNGWFVDEARRRGSATPVHDGLLDAAGVEGRGGSGG